jgi:uncharacterized repeat protein (TIGR04138 family)
MPEPPPSILDLVRQDKRYRLEAYAFVFEALHYAQTVMELGKLTESELDDQTGLELEETERGPQRHVTGQELCEAIRRYALEQYGFMALTVLRNWGVHCTGDFGEIVFNLIRVGRMRKTKHDRREDFDNVYDFDTAFREFKISME